MARNKAADKQELLFTFIVFVNSYIANILILNLLIKLKKRELTNGQGGVNKNKDCFSLPWDNMIYITRLYKTTQKHEVKINGRHHSIL